MGGGHPNYAMEQSWEASTVHYTMERNKVTTIGLRLGSAQLRGSTERLSFLVGKFSKKLLSMGLV